MLARSTFVVPEVGAWRLPKENLHGFLEAGFFLLLLLLPWRLLSKCRQLQRHAASVLHRPKTRNGAKSTQLTAIQLGACLAWCMAMKQRVSGQASCTLFDIKESSSSTQQGSLARPAYLKLLDAQAVASDPPLSSVWVPFLQRWTPS